MAAVTDAISSLSPHSLGAVGPFAAFGLWAQMLLNDKSNRRLSHMGNNSVVKPNRGIGCFSGLSYCEGTAYRLLASLEWVDVARR